MPRKTFCEGCNQYHRFDCPAKHLRRMARRKTGRMAVFKKEESRWQRFCAWLRNWYDNIWRLH